VWLDVSPKQPAGELGVPTSQVLDAESIAWPSGSNYVYLYDKATGLWRSSDAVGHRDPTHGHLYESAAYFPTDIAVGPDGRVYMTLDGIGMLVGTPSP